MIQIEYEHEQTIGLEDPNSTILEVSNQNNIPHIQACGGNGRCSTCRVMIIENLENVSAPQEVETRLILEKGLEKNIRLACQARVTGNVKIRRLVRDEEDIEVALAESEVTSGKEKKLAILFSDIRGFTTFSENNLPYDVIHHLNRYFRKMGEAVLRFDGYIDKYIGDGLMAIYGIDEDDETRICKNAVLSGLMMLEGLEEINQYFQKNYNFSFKIGIGIHFGEAIIGEVGHPKNMQMTVIGDSVNFASRIESMCKKANTNFLISESIYQNVKDEFEIGRKVVTQLKGKSGQYNLYELKDYGKTCKVYRSTVDRLTGFLKDRIFPNIAPELLRLAFHDAFDYDPSTKQGGANGSIRFPESLEHPLNKGLSKPVQLIEGWHEEFNQLSDNPISWADMIAFAGAVAVQKCGGLPASLRLGRHDSEKPSNSDLLPHPDMNIGELLKRFQDAGFTARELTSLSGAHTIGKTDGIPFTEDLYRFNNSYFKRLVLMKNRKDLALLPTDTALMSNEETKNIVLEYAQNNAKFLEDFREAYIHFTGLGMPA